MRALDPVVLAIRSTGMAEQATDLPHLLQPSILIAVEMR
nr:hypothetical protein JVH1_1006 [Rhodococcus sp. JVH1]